MTSPKNTSLVPMATLPSSLFLIALLCSLPHRSTSHSQPSQPSSSNLCKSVCRKSNDYKACIRTVKSDPKLAHAKDINTLAVAAMAKARKETVLLTNLFTRLQMKNPDPRLRAAFKMCAFDFKDAKMFFNAQGLGDVTKSLDIHSALDNFQNCQSMLVTDAEDRKKMEPAMKKWRHFYSIANGAILYAEAQSGGGSSPDDGGPGDYP